MRLLAALVLLLVVGPLRAQVSLSGVVSDQADGRPLARAAVSLIRGGKTVKFARTDEMGHFSLCLASIQAGDSLQATLMGYARKRQAAQAGQQNNISLTSQAFELREVVVNTTPITGRDTIVYDLTRFADDRDNSLKDVLRKLPGVDITQNGQIKYKGKAIDRFTVEGLDLSNGRYNLLTDNIRARDVKKAEVVEHDQPIKALQDKVTTDNVAMNVELKDSVRDRLTFNLRPYVLVGEPTHAGGSANIMQIGKRRQLAYNLQYDRSGEDLTNLSSRFTSDYNSLGTQSLPVWYSLPVLSAPIEEKRLRFNTSQYYSLNNVSKSKSGTENTLTASYTRAVERQHTANTSLYYIEGSTPTTLREDRLNTMVRDQFLLDYVRKLNTERAYGTLTLSLDASGADGLSQIESTGHSATTQRVRLPEVNASAELYRLYTLGSGTLNWKSLVDYHFSRNDLFLESTASDPFRSKLNNRLWHTAHELSYSRTRHFLRRQYALGINAAGLNVSHNNFVGSLYFMPNWVYERGRLRLTYSQVWKLSRYAHQQQTMLITSPTLYANYRAGNRTEWSGYINGGTTADGWKVFAFDTYQSNYRTHYVSASFIPRTRYLGGQVNYSYKRPLRELFMHASLSASRSWRNAVTDMRIEDGNYYYTYLKRNTRSEHVSADASVSKGFYRQHLKATLSASASYTGGEQYVGGELLNYRYRALSLDPQLFFYPSWLQLSYKGSFSFGRSSTSGSSLETLFCHTQRLSLTATVRKVDLSLSAIYYHNQLDATSSVNTLLADARLTWRLKTVRLNAELRNIFNKTAYAETTYSGIGCFTNTYQLRPRELMLSAQFAF